MSTGDQLTQTIDVDQLLLSKRLEPLAAANLATLQKIAGLDVANFSEMEVRSYVIDPVVRILGYDKGTIFSADLEHPVTFLGKNIFPDYKLTLWNENFWLIEAKKPRLGKAEFESNDFRQAIEYSVHPSVNASLVVLCDGLKLEIFDREASVGAPIIRVAIKDLVGEFDKIRAVLEPMQVWFFQKRRVVRLIDKEFNMSRVEEFSDLIGRRLRGKHQKVIENSRNTKRLDENSDLAYVRSAPLPDLVELFLFEERRIPVVNAVNLRLVELSTPASFHVLHRLFPDGPRDATDVYMGQALSYLMRLGENQPTVQWLPSWLTKESTDPRNVEEATAFLLRQCLTYFADYEPYKVILLAANAIRRIAKIMAISNNAVRNVGQALHAHARHEIPEMSWAQIVASPEGQLIGLIDGQVRQAIYGFVKRHSTENYTFRIESARTTLKGIWHLEAQLLGAAGNYAKLLEERSLGDMRSIEWCSVTYDYLGHIALCLMHPFPKWKDYTLQHHRALVENLVRLGSGKAREILAIAATDKVESASDGELANRFFFGDIKMLQTLRAFYRGS